MRLSKELAVLCFSLGAIPLLAGQTSNVEHYGYTDTDRLVQCIQTTYRKPVTRLPAIRGVQFSECPASKSEVLKLLDAKKIRLFETPDWVYLIPSHFFTDDPQDDYYQFRMKWRRLKIVLEATAGNEGVSQSEAQSWSKEVLNNARMVPLFPPQDPTRDDEAIITLRLKFYQVRLHLGGPDSVIATIDQVPEGSDGRLVYGEIRDGAYQILWDSPLYHGYGLPEFTDVNADGNAEILFEAWTPGNV